MPGTNYTTNLRLANPSLNDTGWGTTVSSGMIDLTDQAIAGLATANVTSSDVTLTIDDGSAGVNSARNMFLNITGTPGVAREVIVPTNRKLYFVTNNCGQIATVKVSGQPGVAIPVGATMALRINAAGTDVAPAFTYAASLSLGTALPATSGGTGQSSFAVGDLLYASTTTAISKLTVGATNAVLTVAAGIPSWVTTLGVASGGTGAATFSAGAYLKGNGVSAIAAQVGIPAEDITSGTVATARLASGTANNSTYLRGDQTWASISTTDVLNVIANASVGAIGTYAFLNPLATATIAPGGTALGSSLQYGPNSAGSSSPSGTWRLMGNISTSTGASVWLRIL